MDKKKRIIAVIGLATGSIVVGWYLHQFTESRIPYSYRTGFLILDSLAAVGLRDYNK